MPSLTLTIQLSSTAVSCFGFSGLQQSPPAFGTVGAAVGLEVDIAGGFWLDCAVRSRVVTHYHLVRHPQGSIIIPAQTVFATKGHLMIFADLGKGARNKKWRHSALLMLYESLTLADEVQAVDLIIVLAGRMERKQYGLDLLRAGLTSRLVLSVGRFEVSKMKCLQLPGYEELVLLRDKTPPDKRHFFVQVDSSGMRVENANLARWNTFGEAVAFRDLLKEQHIVQRVMVISTDVHLRRVRLTFRKVCRDIRAQFLFCPVPPALSCVKKERWWTRSRDRRFVFKEFIKLVVYRMILLLPVWFVNWLMPLKRRKSERVSRVNGTL